MHTQGIYNNNNDGDRFSFHHPLHTSFQIKQIYVSVGSTLLQQVILKNTSSLKNEIRGIVSKLNNITNFTSITDKFKMQIGDAKSVTRWALMVVKWSACSPSTPTILVRIPLQFTMFL